MTATMILCAGLGTRLRPLTTWRAKPLVPVGDRPALGHVLAQVRPLGGAIVVNAYHRVADLVAYAAAERLAVSVEEELLGTAGGLARAADALGAGPTLVWNGDILCDVDARALVAAHAGSGALATLAVVPLAAGTGNVGIDHAGRVVRLRAETVAPGEAWGGAFVGVHVVGEALRARLPARGCLVGDVYLPRLREGGRIAAVAATRAFADVGTLEHYRDANFAWLAARGADAWTAAGADVGPQVRLAQSLIGEGARVVGRGTLARCVVWPDAVATAPLEEAIVTPDGVVPVPAVV